MDNRKRGRSQGELRGKEKGKDGGRKVMIRTRKKGEEEGGTGIRERENIEEEKGRRREGEKCKTSVGKVKKGV